MRFAPKMILSIKIKKHYTELKYYVNENDMNLGLNYQSGDFLFKKASKPFCP